MLLQEEKPPGALFLFGFGSENMIVVERFGFLTE